MSLVASDEYRQYSVPRADGTALVEPGPGELLAQLGPPSFVGRPHGIEFCGKPLDLVRQQAREEVLQKAVDYTQTYRDLPDLNQIHLGGPALKSAPLILSGHQPELFHAGVWFKNFLLSRLAAQGGGIGINFLVDNDLCRTPSIRVPAFDSKASAPTHSKLIAKSVLFDAPHDAIPWELRRLGSSDIWRDFPAAVQAALLPGLADPLLLDIWPDAVEAVRRTDRPGLALAEMRHKLEGRIGLNTLEVPLSHLVSTRAFARFSIQLMSELPRFQEIYNSQLVHYRLAHRIRSHAHPVPALAQNDGWLEAPWWVYRQQAPHRQPLWVRLHDDQLMLSDRGGWQATIEGRLDCDNASTQWLDLLAAGVCLRPRALLTTMYLRIMASDLFLHGIGGGKYDQLTDGIVREFFGIEPSPMAVATATLHLPLGSHWPAETGSELAELEAQRTAERDKLWQLKYHAEQFLEESTELQQLNAKKQELLSNIPPRGEKWRWHREISAVNRRLSELASEQADQSREQLKTIAAQEREQRILLSREASFCLFPMEDIAPRLKALAESSS